MINTVGEIMKFRHIFPFNNYLFPLSFIENV